MDKSPSTCFLKLERLTLALRQSRTELEKFLIQMSQEIQIQKIGGSLVSNCFKSMERAFLVWERERRKFQVKI